MATRSELRTKVGTQTGRSGETNFNDVVNAAFDEFLSFAGVRHDFKESKANTLLSISADDYRVSLPAISLTGFQTTIHHIISAIARLNGDSQQGYPLKVRPYTWLNVKYPDRARTGTFTGKPAFVARMGSYLELQAPANDAYDIYLTTSQLPLAFASDSTENPIPVLDSALIAYGVYSVYDAIEAYDQATRNSNKAMTFLQSAIMSDGKEPAVENIAEPPSVMMASGYRFNLAQLQALYPEA